MSVVKGQQVSARAGHQGISVSLIVAKLDEGSFIVNLLHYGPDLATCKSPVGYVRQQRYYVQDYLFSF